MSGGEREQLTIIVPTHNRPAFLKRLLRYYEACGSPFEMQILDSSRERIRDPELEALLRAPRVVYTTVAPTVPFVMKLYEGLQRVTTPYSVFWADDDLLVPRALSACVEFLEAHPDYSIAHGRSGLFAVQKMQGKTALSGVSPYRQTRLTESTGRGRLTQWLVQGGSVFYSVHRTELLRDNVARCHERGFGYHWIELTLGSLDVMQGRAERLEALYMMREIHPMRDSVNGSVPDPFDWVTGAEFARYYRGFEAVLSEALAREDSMSLPSARETVKRLFWFYLARELSKHQLKPLTRDGSSATGPRLRERIRRVPGLRRAWRAIRSVIPCDPTEFSPQALLRTSSRYHEDFRPIYQAVTANHEIAGAPDPMPLLREV